MEQTSGKAKINNKWIRCVYCGHKLGRIVEYPSNNDCIVELKCHSCKTINLCYVNIFEEIQDDTGGD